MPLMSTLFPLSPSTTRLIYGNRSSEQHRLRFSCQIVGRFRGRRSLLRRLVAKAGQTKTWWERLFLDEDHLEDAGLSMSPEEVLGNPLGEGVGADEELSEEAKFQAWKRRAEAITELWEAQEDAKNMESRAWEDWLGNGSVYGNGSVESRQDGEEWIEDDPEELAVPPPEEGLVKTIRELLIRSSEDDMLFEDRVFKYASVNSAKFLAVLVLVPWVVDFLVHDFVLMPFLDRYVKMVPLAAEFFDVKKDQKLEMVKDLKLEKARYRFELEIGMAPPISDDEVWLEMHHKAIEMRDEWRLENRKAFANIWSDMAYGITLFLLICFNQSRVALLKFTGYKILNNISDTGKAFLIILVTDIFLGYHSESGWQAMVEAILEHYGLGVDPAAVTIFVCLVPVVIDACVKLWLFKFLPRLSPNVTNIFREMQRH